MNSSKIIVLTGPESTGKSTLAHILSEQLGAALVPEYARIYLEKNGPDYNISDFKEMLNGQLASEDRIVASTNGLVICDTDVLTFKIWSEKKYKNISKVIAERLRTQKERFYLLCKPDIKWELDVLRENPDDAEELFLAYKESLEFLEFDYCIVMGEGDHRIDSALRCVKLILDGQRSSY